MRYEILFCLDPSPDERRKSLRRRSSVIRSIRLVVFSRRFGQPAATMAGILMTTGETCTVIDVDLQDPPELIVDLYTKLQEGFEVVYARRRSRKGETLVKRDISYLAITS